MHDKARQYLLRIEQDIQANRLILPSLPEVAIRVRQITDDVDSDARDLEREIARDATITARLIKVASSSAVRRGQAVTSLRMAITTLGFSLVRTFVTQMAILQMMNNATDKKRLQGFVASSLTISSLANSLAANLPGINGEQAALAGLLHDLGKLPLRDFLKGQKELSAEESMEVELLLHPEVGAIMLRHWKMDESLVQVAREHETILRDPSPKPDYVDVIIAANILHYGTHSGRYAHYSDTPIPALVKCTQGQDLSSMEKNRDQRMAFTMHMINC